MMGPSDGFDRAMDDVEWADVYDRQRARGDLSDIYCELLNIGRGDDVIELGSGPGFVTEKLSDRVAPGNIYAIDRHPAALQYLLYHIDDREAHVHPIVGDVITPSWHFTTPVTILAAFVFHHLENPEMAPSAIASSVSLQSRILVVEYDPDAAGKVGPPLEHRIAPEKCRTWLASAGIRVIETRMLPEEKYAIVAEVTDELLHDPR